MKYYIKQKVFSLVDRYKIYDKNQEIKYYCDGKFFTIRGVLNLYDSNGRFVFQLAHRLFNFLEKVVYLKDKQDEIVGQITKHFTLFKPRLSVYIREELYEIEGEWLSHDFEINKNGRTIGTITKKWLSWGDTYEIDVVNAVNPDIVIAIAIAIDTIIHNERANNH